MRRLDEIAARLADDRGKRVLFVSHCLLNVNARYLGGAFRRGCVSEIVEAAIRNGAGIVQMPCPEQRAWGGIHKKAMWIALGSEGSPVYLLRGLLAPLFLAYTRVRYRRMAARVAQEIRDYTRSGYTVIGIVGVDGSPSCGVQARLGLRKCFDYFAACKPGGLDREAFNQGLYGRCMENGSGVFTEQLKKLLGKSGLDVRWYAHSLTKEMNGEKSELV